MKKIVGLCILSFVAMISFVQWSNVEPIPVVVSDTEFYNNSLSVEERQTIVKIMTILEPIFEQDSSSFSEYEWQTNSDFFSTVRWKLMKKIVDNIGSEDSIRNKLLKELYFQIAYKKKILQDGVDLEYSRYLSPDYSMNGYDGTIVLEGYLVSPNDMFIEEIDAWWRRIIEEEQVYIDAKSYFFVTQWKNADLLEQHMSLRYNIDVVSDMLDSRFKRSIGLSCLWAYENLDLDVLLDASADNPVRLKVSMTFPEKQWPYTKFDAPINDVYTYYHEINDCNKNGFDNIEVITN